MSGAKPWISGGVATALVLLSALSMLAFLALSAYAPELRTESNGRANVLSKSAIGFAGLRVLLEASGRTVSVNRSHQPPSTDLLILTPEIGTNPSEVEAMTMGPPCLIVLPKWIPVSDPFHVGWVVRSEPYAPAGIAALVQSLDPKSIVAQAKGTSVRIRRAGSFGAPPWTGALGIESFQTIHGRNWDADLTDAAGNAVLAHLRGTRVYVLSDPDLLNTHALQDENKAAGAVELVRQIANGAADVTFDVTLSGFGSKPNLLHAAFALPFLPATLCAILAAALLGLHAASRFGSPREEQRAFAFGKRSLADNTAALIRMMGRQPAMAPRYAQATRRLAAKILGRSRGEEFRWLEAVERSGNVSPRFADLLHEASGVESDSDLLRTATKLHEWRSRITHERT